MVDKLSIQPYLDDLYTQEAKGLCFVAQINPASYSEAGEVEYADDSGIESAGTTPYLVGIRPRTLALDMVLDSTGAVPGGDKSVSDRIAEFKKVVYKIENEIHAPAMLWIKWGSLSFQCVLTSYTVEYTMFDPSGQPLRAKLKASFDGYDSPKTLEAQADMNSPDLTHLRKVKAGDTLPLLCAKIYGDGSAYLRVARYNGLVNFRSLLPGTDLQFPPLRVLEGVDHRP